MPRPRMLSIHLIKGNQTNLRLRGWGIERLLTTPRGNEICTPAHYENLSKLNRKFKILTLDLIDLVYLS